MKFINCYSTHSETTCKIKLPWQEFGTVSFAFGAVILDCLNIVLIFIIDSIIRHCPDLFGTYLATKVIPPHVGINGSNGSHHNTIPNLSF